MSTQSWAIRALDEMQAERAELVARVARLDAAIVACGNLIGLPALPAAVLGERAAPAPPPRRARAETKAESAGLDTEQAILAALREGPMKPGDLAAAVHAERANVRFHVKQLEARGLVVSTGVTMSRRVALAPTAAKEAP